MALGRTSQPATSGASAGSDSQIGSMVRSTPRSTIMAAMSSTVLQALAGDDQDGAVAARGAGMDEAVQRGMGLVLAHAVQIDGAVDIDAAAAPPSCGCCGSMARSGRWAPAEGA